jgi:two-component system chemotaxis sensor kinase CheA
MNALLAQFIPEARDLLEQAGTGLLALERDADSPSAINDVFRAVHTLKGSSGLFDVGPLTRLVHAAEDLLGEVRTGSQALNSEIVDHLLDSLDLVSGWIDALEAHETLPMDAEATMASRMTALRTALAPKVPDVTGGGVVTTLGKGAAPSGAAPAWLIQVPEAERLNAWERASGEWLLAWSFTPEADCFFRGDDPVAMMQSSPGLLAVRVVAQDGAPDIATLDPLSCFFRFEALSDTGRDALEEHMRYVADQVDIHTIATRDLVHPSGDPASGPVFTDFSQLAREQITSGDWDGLGRSVNAVATLAGAQSFQASALRWSRALLSRRRPADLADLARLVVAIETGQMPDPDDPPAAHGSNGQPSVTGGQGVDDEAAGFRMYAERLALEQLTALETPGSEAISQGRLESIAHVLRNIALVVSGDDRAVILDAALAQWRAGDAEPLWTFVRDLDAGQTTVGVPDAAETPTPPAWTPETRQADTVGDPRPANRILRVDQSRIDSIMNLVAELIVAKNGLSYIATRAEEVHGARAVAREIKDQFAVIDRITQGLQVGVMSVRMMPVSQVFQRFPRLVRDVSRKLGKQIDLIIEGEETEADKNVLESLADPLIHMVRNSLDHGIETPEERRAAGKPEHGVLRITARQESDFVVIEVRDDGRGIDAGRVRTKAIERGLISAERAAQLTDEEAANLVFTAGFSTKDEVSDLSGRGVGMDVVRTAVIKAGGDVALRTTLGAGTTVSLRLPLTMAVTRIVTIECRGRLFGIPMDAVAETVRIGKAQIRRIKTSETFVLRESIIPIVRLAQVMDLPSPADAPEIADEAVMVVKLGQDRIGLVVDGFRERMEVIVKPLEGILEGLPGFSGTALLGDGRVLLILDLKEIL